MGFLGMLAHEASHWLAPAAEAHPAAAASPRATWMERAEEFLPWHGGNVSTLFEGLYDHECRERDPQRLTYTATDHSPGARMQSLLRGERADRPSNPTQIAADVQRRASDAPIQSIQLDGHAQPGSQWLSETDYLQPALSSHDREAFGKIGGSIAPGGEIDLAGCNVARGEQGQELMKSVAEASGRDVHGGTARQLWGVPGILGPEVIAHPDGTSETKTSLLRNAYGWLDSHVPW